MEVNRVTETLIFRVRDGVTLSDVVPTNASDATTSAAQVFAQLRDGVRAQSGFIHQFWGHQVENHAIFFWCIDWKSVEDQKAAVDNLAKTSYDSDLSKIFDIEAATPIKLLTGFSSSATAAFKSPVTEIAFCTIPSHHNNKKGQQKIEEMLVPVERDVKAVGKAWGCSLGWFVDDTSLRDNKAVDRLQDGHQVALHGVFGYASIGDHMRWRETPEHAEAIKIMGRLAEEFDFRDIDVHGQDMWHVKFFWE